MAEQNLIDIANNTQYQAGSSPAGVPTNVGQSRPANPNNKDPNAEGSITITAEKTGNVPTRKAPTGETIYDVGNANMRSFTDNQLLEIQNSGSLYGNDELASVGMELDRRKRSGNQNDPLSESARAKTAERTSNINKGRYTALTDDEIKGVKQRIKDGEASDDDIAVAMYLYDNGKYNEAGPKTKEAIENYRKNNVFKKIVSPKEGWTKEDYAEHLAKWADSYNSDEISAIRSMMDKAPSRESVKSSTSNNTKEGGKKGGGGEPPPTEEPDYDSIRNEIKNRINERGYTKQKVDYPSVYNAYKQGLFGDPNDPEAKRTYASFLVDHIAKSLGNRSTFHAVGNRVDKTTAEDVGGRESFFDEKIKKDWTSQIDRYNKQQDDILQAKTNVVMDNIEKLGGLENAEDVIDFAQTLKSRTPQEIEKVIDATINNKLADSLLNGNISPSDIAFFKNPNTLADYFMILQKNGITKDNLAIMAQNLNNEMMKNNLDIAKNTKWANIIKPYLNLGKDALELGKDALDLGTGFGNLLK